MLATVPCVRLLSVGNYSKALLLTASGMKCADKYARKMIKCTNVKKEKKGGLLF